MSQRNVSISTLFKLTLTTSKLPIVGLALLFFSAVLFPLISLQVSTITGEFAKYDYSALDNDSKEYTATITDISVMGNVSINGRNPYIISYTFNYNNSERYDNFATTDWLKAANLTTGDEITILANSEKSKIKGFDSLQFPYQIFYVFYIMPTVFLVGGLILVLLGLIPALKTYKIYKNGIVKDGIIELMVPKKNNVLVTYSYEGAAGVKLSGKSIHKFADVFPLKKMNDPIKIFVLPTDERKSAMVPLKNNW